MLSSLYVACVALGDAPAGERDAFLAFVRAALVDFPPAVLALSSLRTLDLSPNKLNGA